ncbi:MAG: ribosome small subunit-dependent GTPase A [Desulfitobacteriaceae bacterium]|nr:ribosome small subunit-dependent GTPase A [Desulfitobacteriaceae bacterium]
MKEGILLKRYGGFYFVKSEGLLWECTLRGKFRKLKQDFFPGDKVLVSVLDDHKGVIEGVLPRINLLRRPPVANVEQVLVVFAFFAPDPDFLLLDRLLIMAQHEKVHPVICFTKADTVDQKIISKTIKGYQNAGYQTVVTSSKTGLGIEKVRYLLKNRISVFAGPSGAGKSSLLNALQPGLSLKTGDVSEKIGRGRHTTRHVELLELEFAGLVADTPGFSNLDLPDITREELQHYFPEIVKRADCCRFTSCLHNQEPDCSVKEALVANEIDYERYQRYLILLQEVMGKERRY